MPYMMIGQQVEADPLFDGELWSLVVSRHRISHLQAMVGRVGAEGSHRWNRLHWVFTGYHWIRANNILGLAYAVSSWW